MNGKRKKPSANGSKIFFLNTTTMKNNTTSTATKQGEIGHLSIDADAIRKEAKNFFTSNGKIEHAKVLQEVLDNLQEVDFRSIANVDDEQKVSQKVQRVLTVDEVLRVARDLNCGLCRNQDFVYAYNGEFWQLIDRNELESFLGEASNKLGVDDITARDYEFKAKLFKQFMADAYLPKPENQKDVVLINLRNGTFEITENEQKRRDFCPSDFLTYQLPFEYQAAADCPKWQNFLDEVLPDKSRQNVLAEYMGYVFARNLKLEKTLILYGTGANGKSVVSDVTNTLLGKENVSNFSLESLGENYFRAMIANKLLNYSSEISNRLQVEKFKQLTSGEPVEARLPYGQPMTLTNYARLAFNCNELPKDVEHTEAFFRRFLILPFDIMIPENRRNPNLAKEIIGAELSGVFNWILDGLKRLLQQNGFSPCDAAQKMVDTFRRESDSVAMLLDDEGYKASNDNQILLKDLYQDYKTFCQNDGYKPLGKRNFKKRLEGQNISVGTGTGNKVFVGIERT